MTLRLLCLIFCQRTGWLAVLPRGHRSCRLSMSDRQGHGEEQLRNTGRGGCRSRSVSALSLYLGRIRPCASCSHAATAGATRNGGCQLAGRPADKDRRSGPPPAAGSREPHGWRRLFGLPVCVPALAGRSPPPRPASHAGAETSGRTAAGISLRFRSARRQAAWDGRDGRGRRVTADAVGRPFVHVTANDRDRVGMRGGPAGSRRCDL